MLLLRWGSFQNGSDTSTTRDLLNDVLYITEMWVMNEPGVFTNEKWIIQNHDVRHGGIQSLCNYMEL